MSRSIFANVAASNVKMRGCDDAALRLEPDAMNRSEHSDEGTDENVVGSERLQAFNKAMWDALVPSSASASLSRAN